MRVLKYAKSLAVLIGLCAIYSVSSPQEPEETKMVVGKTTFEGVRSFSSKTLIEEMRTKEGRTLDEFQLRQDLRRIETFYRENGFLEAKAIEHTMRWDLERMRVDIVIRIEEGPQWHVGEVKIVGNESFTTAEILRVITLKPNQPLDEEELTISELRILSLYGSTGRIYSEVNTLTEPTEDSHSVKLTFMLREGPEVRVGEIRVEGNEGVSSKVVTREIVVKEGQIYDQDGVYESQRRIYATGLFRDVKFQLKGVEEKRKVVDLTFLLKEEKPRWFGLGGGYQSPDRVELNGEWGHNNILRRGQTFTVRGSHSFNLKGEYKQEFGARYLEPYLFSSPFKLMLHLFHNREKEEEFFERETGGGANVGRYFGKTLYGSLHYGYKFATLDILEPSDKPELEATTNSVSISFTRDTRDSYFDPTMGSMNFLSLERAGGVLGGSNNFNRFIIDSSLFLRVWRRAVLAMRLKQGYTQTFGLTTPEKLSSDQRFELGGANSVRGYGDASIGPIEAATGKHNGTILTNLNLELRFPLPFAFPVIKTLAVGYFADCGGIWMERKEIAIEDLKWGAGVGLRWVIPYLGPVRFDLGWPLTDGEASHRLHYYLVFGHAF